MDEIIVRISDNHGRNEKIISVTDKSSKIVLVKILLSDADYKNLFIKEKDTSAKLMTFNDFKHRGKELWNRVKDIVFVRGRKKYIMEQFWK